MANAIPQIDPDEGIDIDAAEDEDEDAGIEIDLDVEELDGESGSKKAQADATVEEMRPAGKPSRPQQIVLGIQREEEDEEEPRVEVSADAVVGSVGSPTSRRKTNPL